MWLVLLRTLPEDFVPSGTALKRITVPNILSLNKDDGASKRLKIGHKILDQLYLSLCGHILFLRDRIACIWQKGESISSHSGKRWCPWLNYKRCSIIIQSTYIIRAKRLPSQPGIYQDLHPQAVRDIMFRCPCCQKTAVLYLAASRIPDS